MDKLDKSILSKLQENAKISNLELSEKVGLSPSACLRRVNQLQDSDIINGYHANLNLEKIGFSVLVLVNISLYGQSSSMLKEFENAVKKIPQILTCFLVAGESDYLLKIAAKDVNDFGRIHTEYLSSLPNVQKMESVFVLREITNRGLDIMKI